jgi:hypothetical protein
VAKTGAFKNGLSLSWRQLDAVGEDPYANGFSAIANKRAKPNRDTTAIIK